MDKNILITPPKQGIDPSLPIQTVISAVINLFYIFGAIAVLIFFLWGAIDWVTSGGDKEKVASARKKITAALVGLLLMGLAFVIVRIAGSVVGFDPTQSVQIPTLGRP